MVDQNQEPLCNNSQEGMQIAHYNMLKLTYSLKHDICLWFRLAYFYKILVIGKEDALIN